MKPPSTSRKQKPESTSAPTADSAATNDRARQSLIIKSEPIFTHSEEVKQWIRTQAQALGFADCGFLSVHHPLFTQQITQLQQWLAKGYEGQLQFMHNNHHLRAHPEQLVEGAKTIISVRMDYLTEAPKPRAVTDNDLPNQGIVARYARGRDYHKTMRSRLKKLALEIEAMLPKWEHLNIGSDKAFVFRPFSDSAPIFERPIADAAGLGWTGKHTLLLNKQAGSFFVLGELFVSIELPDDAPVKPHCGSCSACIDICPTQAIVAPYELNAAACISYLTIEHDGIIDPKYRRAIGNRVFGCDDCQLICPWNRYANITSVEDFSPRHRLDNSSLLELWQWQESDFMQRTQGSPLRRTGYVNFLRNIAIGLGNANSSQVVIDQLRSKLGMHNEILDEHIHWAIAEQIQKRAIGD
ncbi:tRNA epoxyqueuosine(34) reductase QueG [Psychrobacter sp.]|uniref:tRNA epoxyqueuosine(34) reductase QueG n=1 Tax=Psychrobacter sp. TaxID=56811 RepID=UPI002647DB03|nr:tRNA epoxyqueuosine(34) reductase QueG [Psychrobacter sp.]MDN6275499.1 tRNA epoxyqueuosine(34) reductase QueG [Psychrobacter sp.]MDN6307518.1 tRNA epoxyqueuosine(34) reductase QueG [Psychrobacter sp.]